MLCLGPTRSPIVKYWIPGWVPIMLLLGSFIGPGLVLIFFFRNALKSSLPMKQIPLVPGLSQLWNLFFFGYLSDLFFC